MKRSAVIVLAGVLTMAIPVVAWAQYDSQPTPSPREVEVTQAPQGAGQMAESQTATQTQDMTGTLVSVSETSLVIRLDNGDQTIFHRDTRSDVPTALSTGNRVRVEYSTPEPGVFHASRVLLEADGSTSMPASAGMTSSPADVERRMDTQTADGSMESMPATASPLPLLAILGLLAFGGGLVMHSSIRR